MIHTHMRYHSKILTVHIYLSLPQFFRTTTLYYYIFFPKTAKPCNLDGTVLQTLHIGRRNIRPSVGQP